MLILIIIFKSQSQQKVDDKTVWLPLLLNFIHHTISFIILLLVHHLILIYMLDMLKLITKIKIIKGFNNYNYYI